MDFDIWSISIIVAKFIAYISTFIAVGTFLFIHLLKADTRVVSKPFTLFAIFLAMLASFAMIPLNVGLFNDEGFAGMFDYQISLIIIDSPIGISTMLRISGLALLFISFYLKGNSQLILGAAASLLTTWSFTQIGHLSNVEPALVKLVLMTHLLGIAFWVGAFIPLYRAASGVIALPEAADLSHRFGQLALYIVGALFFAGVVMSIILLGNPSQLLTNEYGQTLGIKILLFFALLSLAALNKLRLVPSLKAGQPNAAIKLQRSIILEIVIVSVILVLTAMLTTVTQLPAHH